MKLERIDFGGIAKEVVTLNDPEASHIQDKNIKKSESRRSIKVDQL